LNLADFSTLAVLVVGSFVATNLDNLLLLVFLLGSAARRRSAVLLGFLTSVILVVTIAALGVAAGALLDPGLIGYLGIAPISMGCYLLYQHRRSTDTVTDVDSSIPSIDDEGGIWLATSVLMFSNSGDSIAVLLPLVAESNRSALLLIFSFYLLSSLLWCALALAIALRPGLARRIQQRGAKLVPWIMIGVGIYVLLDTGTDTLL
jgi:cadmium resistance protein CadD (predicted permease)